MNRLPVSALFGLLFASFAPAAQLIIEPEVLNPKSTVELRFDQPMIAKDRVGSVDPSPPLVITPAVQGDFKWTSTRSGQFLFTQPIAMGTKYAFALREGLKDAEGKPVAAEKLGERESEKFGAVAEGSGVGQSGNGAEQRVGRVLLQFSDAVDLADTNGFYFQAKEGKDKFPVTVRAAAGKDFAVAHNPEMRWKPLEAVPTWAERFAGKTPELQPSEARSNAVVVETKVALPAGAEWTLHVPAKFPNAAKTTGMTEEFTMEWGSIEAMKVVETRHETHFDRAHEATVVFNKTLATDETLKKNTALFAPFIKVDPPVPNMKLEVDWQTVNVSGDFELEKPYKISVSAGLPGSDGLNLEEPAEETVVFHPSATFVSTSAFESSQMSGGKAVFDIFAANYENIHVRVKQLSDANLLEARDLYASNYYENTDETDDNGNKKRIEKAKITAFEAFPGKVVFDKSFANDKPLERGTVLNLNWHEILGQVPAAPAFIEIEATPQKGAPGGNLVNRAIVEFTDIGLVVKSSGRETLVHAFSLRTGDPLPNIQVSINDEVNRAVIATANTDASGIAVLPGEGAAWVLGKNGADCTAVRCGGERSKNLALWRSGVNMAWRSPWQQTRQTFVFADRPVYKPGDTAHVKAITRLREGDALKLDGKAVPAHLTLSDPRGHAVLTKNVTFTANGSWNDEITFPEGLTGYYTLNLSFGKAKADEETDDDEKAQPNGSLALRVDEYKPNTFEVKLDGEKFKVTKDRITVPLKANYYMGKALSKAKLSWNAGIQQEFTAPQAFAEYTFGDVPSYWHYGEDRGEGTARQENEGTQWGAHGELSLAEDGTATIELPMPPPQKAALPQNITVDADVTDVNEQTISATTEFMLPGAEFIIGAKHDKWCGFTNQPLKFDLTSITPQGKPFGSDVLVDLKVERQEWTTIREQAAGGATTTRNQMKLIEEQRSSVKLGGSKEEAPSITDFAFTPKKSGTYFLTATAKSAGGLTVLTRLPFYVIGGEGFPWAWEDGAQITLQPDKTSVEPGGEVSIVVKSPIAGKALVTVERNRIHRHFIATITQENPVIKVPITEEDAPNVYVSVVVIRGAAGSPQPDPMPEYRLGYCKIDVLSDKHDLNVEVKPAHDTLKPGEEQTITALLKNTDDKPVAGAEVTLYAVDEGVLSLMSYETPDLGEFFTPEAPLWIKTYLTLTELLSESMDARYRGNKGILIGGGGPEAVMAPPPGEEGTRRKFITTPLWKAALISDEKGQVSATFTTPDTLTRYRIMAVAASGADNFGSGESAFVVNKPLMVEPAVPRFAHLGDELLIKAVVHNTTKEAGEVEVELKLDDTATLITEARTYVPVALTKNRTLTNDGKTERRVISLKAGETTAIAFPVRFTKTGTSSWQWRVHTTGQWPGEALSDGVESRFEVTHPSPSLREVHYVSLTSSMSKDDLLKQINPQLLESDGELRLDVSRSRMGEARDALDHVLHYPYGCVEQTTSNLLPWLALSKYEPMFPDLLQKDKTRAAIQRGVDKLLQMQTEEGGLAYWPGGTKPMLWASAYGGFGLVKAKDWGMNVPQEALDKLAAWMSEELRKLEIKSTRKSEDLCDAALAVYTLAKLGKPETSYQTLLYQRRDRLPETSRLFLALAMCLNKSPEKQIKDLLPPPAKNTWERYWLGPNTADGLRLLVCAHLGLTKDGERIADEVLRARNGQGHWGTTFSNAWILLGLSASEKADPNAGPVNFSLTWGDRKSDLNVAGLNTATAFFDFNHDKGASPLHVTLPGGAALRGRVEVKSWPDFKTFQPVEKGFGIHRTYQRLTPTGELEEAKNLRVGDLIVVKLHIEALKPNRYIAIEDPLPSVFEPVNPEFGTQNHRADAKKQDNSAWTCDFRELRNDKALFFTNEWSQIGKFELSYLARVIAEGDVIVPPTRIEAMYEPDHYGLGEIQRLQTLPMTNGANVADK